MEESTHSPSDQQEESIEKILLKRKEALVRFIRKQYLYLSYVVLAAIVWMATFIRTRNLPGLRDVTTGTWTLGPDLDPFLFLRWAKYIVDNGSLYAIDTMRSVPVYFQTSGELLLHPYLIAWFHKLASAFGSESVTHSAVLYPVVMFGLTVIAFFFLTKELFVKPLGPQQATLIALIASFFLGAIPTFLNRTIAGIPEKESAAFLFMFLALFFYVKAWNTTKPPRNYIFALLAGISTAGMALIWGGYAFIFLVIAPTVFVAFILGKIDATKIRTHAIWVFSALALMYPFSQRYTLTSFVTSLYIAPALIILLVYVVHVKFMTTPKAKQYIMKLNLTKIPLQLVSLITTGIGLALLATVIIGPSFISSQFSFLYDSLVAPNTSRLIQTVAENRQPYLLEWIANYGPTIRGIHIFFWLFLIGAVLIFFLALADFKRRQRIAMTAAFALLTIAIPFSRYDSASTFNGVNTMSLLLYFAGFVAVLGLGGYYYYQRYKSHKDVAYEKMEFSYILLIVFFLLSILGARGSIRLILMLAPTGAILASFTMVYSVSVARKIKDTLAKLIVGAVVLLILLGGIFAGYSYYQSSKSIAQGFVPSEYTQQWQYAMSWVRDNTPENAVFGHWWDYGYWLQSMGERATVLDGGNVISYWNHLMGRHALTGPDTRDALEFLYAHQTTHFLIDSTDIGKYTAFSSIGSDQDYDRRSWIATFLRDRNQMFEAKNRTVFIYTGGIALDEDIVYTNDEGQRLFLPAQNTGVGAFRIEISDEGTILQPRGIFVYNQLQQEIPLRYAFYNGTRTDFGSGLEAGVFIYPALSVQGDQVSIDPVGALLYMSPRTVNSQLARIYLYGEEQETFVLSHTESSLATKSLREQGAEVGEFVYYNGLRGPIKIWEINYPADITVQEDYLNTDYPDELKFA